MTHDQKPSPNKIDPKIRKKPESGSENKDECESVLDGPSCIDGIDEQAKSDRRRQERPDARLSSKE